jgi:NO-binding membrane sensor protein with MHYT domain
MTGGHHFLLSDSYYTTGYYATGLVTRGGAFLLSCVGAFLAVRCASRARASAGASRVRWLLLAGVSAGAIGAWAADFIGLLGVEIPGQTVRYSVPVTLACLAAGAGFLCAGLLATGMRQASTVRLAAVAVITGLGVAFMHYLGVAAMRVPASVSYQPGMLAVSAVLAIIAAAAVLWTAARLRGTRAALAAAVITGLAVSGMHDAGTAAVRLAPAAGPQGMILGGGGGATTVSFLFPLSMGLAITVFAVSWAVALAPTEEAIRYDESLLDYIHGRSRAPLSATPLTTVTLAPRGGSTADRSAPPWTFADLHRPRTAGHTAAHPVAHPPVRPVHPVAHPVARPAAHAAERRRPAD